MPERGRPTPPVALPDGERPLRISAPRVEVADPVLDRLRAACDDVRTGDAELAEHGRDWWPLSVGWAVHDGSIPSRPGVVVAPRTVEEVSAVLRIASEARIPVTTMGGRSGVVGGSLPVHGGIALDTTAFDGIRSVDDASLTVDVGAGMFGDVFEDELRARYGLTAGHWPQSIALSTVGGWVACRGAGQYSTRYGKIEDIVRGLDVVLADGTVLHTGDRGPREAAGPDLTQLFVGSEGTLGVITGVRLQVWPAPTHVEQWAYRFPTFAAGLEACRVILRKGATPAVLRLYDERESARNFGTGKAGTPEAANVLIVLDEGEPELVSAGSRVGRAVCESLGGIEGDPAWVTRWMGHRNDVSQMESVIRNDIVLDTIEIAAPWGPLPPMYERITERMLAVPGAIAATCHQSHAYPDGACLYFSFAGRPGGTLAEREAFYTAMWDAATRTTLELGGTVSHHHGVGLNRARFMAQTLGTGATEVLATVKQALDPFGILNPGKLGLPDPFGEVTLW